jgi:glycosyltransferase involved in cell wall biosynthesis
MPRAVQLISRLSVGGSVLQAINTAAFLRDLGWDTVLLHGEPGPGEGSMQAIADQLGVERVVLPAMTRELGRHDARSLAECRRELVRLRPDVVHTHAAKAGAVGRVAARLARAPAVVHTFHGHVLRGYFGPRKERAFRLIERGLARACDRIVAVSDEVRDDLVELHVASAAKIDVIPVGFDMRRLSVPPERHAELRGALRRELGLPDDALVVTFVGRVVPIKRADRFLAAALELRDSGAQFVVVGDGEALADVRSSDAARTLGDRVLFTGYRADVAAIYHASDVVVLTSDNEGTPVSLIEAAACGVPVVGTDVGGVRSVVQDGVTGYVVPPDASLVAARIATLLEDGPLRARLGAAGRERVQARYAAERLAADHDRLYRELLAQRGS